jgi:hypothetical protein
MSYRFLLKIISLCLLMFPFTASQANEIKPFKTDGCSMWMDGPPLYPNLWRHCCVAHDLAYWQGGTKEQRAMADNAIQACVLEAAESKGMANYMHGMIRWGGSPYWMNYYRWGYGWNYWDSFMKPRGYKIPSIKEQIKINEQMPAAIKVIEEDAIANPPTKVVEKLAETLKK